MAKPQKWTAKVEHLVACNCNFGCPCSFNAPPTRGHCEASTATRIVKARVLGVDLDGLKYVVAAAWPGALHERHGRAVIWLDERAKGEKRSALEAFASGKLGGPWGIFMATVTEGTEVRTAKIAFKFAGKKSSFAVAGATEVAFAPIRNPVTQAESRAIALLPTGLLTKKEEFFTTSTMWVKADGLEFAYPGRHSLDFVTTWRGP
jgi:hypothetical protein